MCAVKKFYRLLITNIKHQTKNKKRNEKEKIKDQTKNRPKPSGLVFTLFLILQSPTSPSCAVDQHYNHAKQQCDMQEVAVE